MRRGSLTPTQYRRIIRIGKMRRRWSPKVLAAEYHVSAAWIRRIMQGERVPMGGAGDVD